MAIGFVLITTEASKEMVVCNALKKMAEVLDICPLFEEYDIIIKIEAPGYDKIGAIVNRIRTIDGVLDTKTLTGINAFAKE